MLLFGDYGSCRVLNLLPLQLLFSVFLQDPAQVLDSALSTLDLQLEVLDRVECRIETLTSGVPASGTLGRRDGSYCMTGVRSAADGHPAHYTAVIGNPDYAAELESRDGERWAIRRFSQAGEPLYAELVKSWSAGHSVQNGGLNVSPIWGVAEASLAGALRLLDRSTLRIRMVTDGECDAIVSGEIERAPSLPEEAVPFHYIDLLVTADGEDGRWLPVGMTGKLRFPGPDGHEDELVDVHARLADWVTVQGVSLPQGMRYWVNSSTEEPPLIETRVFYSEEVFDVATARLSYYGLPEPPVAASRWWKYALGVLLMGGVALWAYRRFTVV